MAEKKSTSTKEKTSANKKVEKPVEIKAVDPVVEEVKVEEPKTVELQNTKSPEYRAVVTAYRLNIRKRPSLDSQVVKTVTIGTELIVEDSIEGWAFTNSNGVIGFIKKEFLSYHPIINLK